MKLILAKHIGLCESGKACIAKALQAKEYGLPVFTLGQLLHNEYACRSLEREGLKSVDRDEALALKNCALVIRAHGASRKFKAALDPSVKVVDATCPNVAKVREVVETAIREGCDAILLGDEKHDEIKAIIEDWPDVVVIGSEEEALRHIPRKNAVLASQTTLAQNKYEILANILDIAYKKYDKTLVKKRTICYTTIVRREESVRLAERCDAMMVIGSARSANTCALVELCRDHSQDVVLVESAQDVGKIKTKQKISTVGVATGASTPLELVTEVITRMSIEEKAVNGEEVEVTVDESAAEVISAPQEEEKAAPITTMAQALESMVDIKPGAVLNCKVLTVRDDGLIVACGQKKDGFISAENCGVEEYDQSKYSVGDTFKAKIIENKEKDKSLLTLSKKAVDQDHLAREARAEAEKELTTGKFDVVVNKAVKGGLLGSKGDYIIFIPASHVDVKHVEQEELESYVGQTITVKKLPPKKEEGERESSGKRIVASRKNVLLAERRQQAAERKKAREERIAKEEQEKKDIFDANKDRFEVNNIVPGVVKKFVTFGVFVNVYGFDCLCPSSEISWVRHADPATILEQGKEYEFLIIKVDPDNYKVTLSYKQIQRQPYEVAAEKYPEGTIVKGTVQSIVKFGAFISIEPGVDGLVHISNISNDKIESVEDVLTVGQEVEAKVISFNDNRIALSIKDLNAPAKSQEEGERPARAPRKRNFDRPQQERKPRKPEDNLMSEEEKQNMEAYNAGASATNNAFAEMLANFAGSDDETDGDNN